MPFKVGAAPIRRTLEFLNSGKLVFKPRVQIMTINYNDHGDHHKGARDFVFWNLPQIQYKNPNIQILTFLNQTPSPFITCYLEDQRQVHFDIDSQTNAHIQERLVKILGKTEQTLEAEELASQKKDNPANFGENAKRFCICTQAGQVPCPSLVAVPKHWRGKYFIQKFEDEEES